MTNRERAMNLLHFKPVDRVPAVHFGYWPELLTEWAEQGKIPAELAVGNYDGSPKDMELDKLIGWDFNWFHTVGCNNGLFPAFETKVLEVLPRRHKASTKRRRTYREDSPRRCLNPAGGRLSSEGQRSL